MITHKVADGQMFGGAGSAVFRPYRAKQSASETGGLTDEALLAGLAESSLLRLVSGNQPQNTEKPEKE